MAFRQNNTRFHTVLNTCIDYYITDSRQPSRATAMAVVFLDVGDQSDFNM